MTTDSYYEARLESETDLSSWRKHVRSAIANQIPPDKLQWQVSGHESGLLLADTLPLPETGNSAQLTISKAYLAQIMTALLHSDPQRFDLVYRLVWRGQYERKLHLNPADADVKRLNQLVKSVRRDIHKMHAFVRFRKTGICDSREQFVSWFEPDHHIVEAVAPFFRNRFTGMDWLIVTPERSVAWDGKSLLYGPGGEEKDVRQEDAIEEEWRTYYASIFNPARVKIQAMKSEMPVKYWRNLPEARLIPDLIEGSAKKLHLMLQQNSHTLNAPALDDYAQDDTPATLEELFDRLEKSSDAPRENFSDNLVRGEGPEGAKLMFVGEQPGDIEDQQGRPFAGPAGQLLDRALADAGILRETAYLTNAVKRFKFIPRGKKRLHQTPNAGEIDYYRWWVEQERRIVNPTLTVALGATAARAFTGKPVIISRVRGAILPYQGGGSLLITVHPSFLLRIPDEAGRKIEYEKFVRDLKLAVKAVQAVSFSGSGNSVVKRRARPRSPSTNNVPSIANFSSDTPP